MGRTETSKTIVAGLLVGIALTACTGTKLNEQVHAAWGDRKAASARLIKAMAGYCAARFETLEGRIDCLAGQNDRWRERTWGGAGEAVSGHVPVSSKRAPLRYARMFTCEHHRTAVVCLRAGHSWAQALTTGQ
jgi:hypothetical protein